MTKLRTPRILVRAQGSELGGNTERRADDVQDVQRVVIVGNADEIGGLGKTFDSQSIQRRGDGQRFSFVVKVVGSEDPAGVRNICLNAEHIYPGTPVLVGCFGQGCSQLGSLEAGGILNESRKTVVSDSLQTFTKLCAGQKCVPGDDKT